MRKPTPEQTVELTRQLDRWADRMNSQAARDVVIGLANAYAAAGACMDGIDALVEQQDVAISAESLVSIQTWLYSELQVHMEALADPLDRLLDDLYREGPD